MAMLWLLLPNPWMLILLTILVLLSIPTSLSKHLSEEKLWTLNSVWFPLGDDHVGVELGDRHRMMSQNPRRKRRKRRKNKRVNLRQKFLNLHQWMMFLCLHILFRVRPVHQVNIHPFGIRFWTIKLPCKGNWILWIVTKKRWTVANARWSTNSTSTSFT